MSRVLALVVLAAMAAKPAGWRAAEGGRVTFSGEQVGGAYSGMITGIAGEGCFDPAHPEAASGRFAFDLAMATTGIRDRDDIMRAPEWLNTARFPEAVFKIVKVSAAGAGAFEAEGALTVKGVTRPLTVPFRIEAGSERLTATGSAVFDRRDFNVGQGPWGETEKWVGFKIEAAFTLVAAAANMECRG